MKSAKRHNRGQATIEYIFVLVFVLLLGTKFISGFRNFVGKSYGNLAHVLQLNLSTGVCAKSCYYGDYENKFK